SSRPLPTLNVDLKAVREEAAAVERAIAQKATPSNRNEAKLSETARALSLRHAAARSQDVRATEEGLQTYFEVVESYLDRGCSHPAIREQFLELQVRGLHEQITRLDRDAKEYRAWADKFSRTGNLEFSDEQRKTFQEESLKAKEALARRAQLLNDALD